MSGAEPGQSSEPRPSGSGHARCPPTLSGALRSRFESLRDKYHDGLLTDVVPFWLQHGCDHKFGGIITSLDRDGAIVDTDKAIWQQGRFAWLMGELYNTVQPRAEWLGAARSAAGFLETYGFDPEDGRMWFQVSRDGRPIRKRRYAFSESFAAIAFGELATATGEQRYADIAVKCFRRFIDHNLEPTGVQPKFTQTRPMKSIGFPMITIATAQELRDSIQLDFADEWIDRSIDDIRTNFLKRDLRCVMETVGMNGELLDSFEGRTLNPGHAIEGAWFILQEGKHRGDEALIQMGCDMFDWMWERGWDDQYGGMLYFVDVYGKPVQEYWHDMKFWWPQCEAIIAGLLAWSLTGDQKYAERHQQAHDWFYDHFADHEHGEFFGYLHRDARVSSPLKGNLWKGPFHIPRMQLVCWKLLTEILKDQEPG